MRRIATAVLALALAAVGAGPVTAEVPVTLRGSLTAMERQHGVALALGYRFARTPNELALLEAQGELVRLEGNDDYEFRAGVESMLARPEMWAFLERLSADYRRACDERLVVTSLTRPITRQPPNAHRLSVHPAGIAVDLRVSRRPACRVWLEETLLSMEEAELLDVTKEWSPPHYHVALFPERYMAHLAPILAEERAREERASTALRAAADSAHELAASSDRQAEGRKWRMVGMLSAGLLGVLVLRRY